MEISALLTSAGINIGICAVLISLYSILRKQPSNRSVYFGRRLAQIRSKRRNDPHWFDRFVPSPSWILKAWETSEDVILAIGGLDAVVFVRTLVFSIRIFSIAAIVCTVIVLPLNYYGQEMQHKLIPSESLEVFTTQNIKEGSQWLWAHCLALYIISCSACILLYFESKNIIRRRLTYIKGSGQDLSQFAVLVRGIPWSAEESYSTSLKNYFTKYHPSTYVSHQMVYRCGKIEKLMKNVKEMYDVLYLNDSMPSCHSCGFPRGRPDLFSALFSEPELTDNGRFDFRSLDLRARGKECPAAFVIFNTRYAASCAAKAILSSNPMMWVTHLAPEPRDVYWQNLAIPYKLFWLRRTATLMATAAFLVFFIAPVALVQSLANLTQLQQMFPFMRGLLKKEYMSQLVTGYLPSVILVLFFYTVPPLMMLFSTIEGSISRSARKRGACNKVLFFTIWNVFFVNIASGTVLNKLDIFSKPKYIPLQLATGAVAAVKFFMTYVLTSGWTSLAGELVQVFPLLLNFIYKFVLRKNYGPYDGGLTFPYHTEFPRVLFFGLLGLSFAVLAPLILPLLLVYYSLAYLVYRNQMLNVYITEYDSGGRYWPIVITSTIFSLVLAQIMAIGLFILKRSPVCLGFTIPLTILTLLFNQYCRRRFLPVFKDISSEALIDLDQQDEQGGRMEEIHQQVQSAYSQLDWLTCDSTRMKMPYLSDDEDCWRKYTQELKPGGEFSQQLRAKEYSQEIASDYSQEIVASEYSHELRATEYSQAIKADESIQVDNLWPAYRNTDVEHRSHST